MVEELVYGNLHPQFDDFCLASLLRALPIEQPKAAKLTIFL
jgi:hypothetical protein